MGGVMGLIKENKSKHHRMWGGSLPAWSTYLIIITLLPWLAVGEPRHKPAKLKFQDNDISPAVPPTPARCRSPVGGLSTFLAPLPGKYTNIPGTSFVLVLVVPSALWPGTPCSRTPSSSTADRRRPPSSGFQTVARIELRNQY